MLHGSTFRSISSLPIALASRNPEGNQAVLVRRFIPDGRTFTRVIPNTVRLALIGGRYSTP